MTKQINKSRKLFLLTVVAIFIVSVASGSAFAQKADKYPKPDFSEMLEYFDIVEHEYEFTGLGSFSVIAKPKQKAVPRWWTITWRDEKGVAIVKHTLMFNSAELSRTKIGEPIRGSAYAPEKRLMPRVKSVTVTENPEGGDGSTAN